MTLNVQESSRYFIPSSAKSSTGHASPPPSFHGHTLVIPTVSFASIPQLAVGLLLWDDALALRKVGRLNSSGDLIPFVGPSETRPSKGDSDGDGAAGITTPLEVFSNASHKITVLQQRSPVLKDRKRSFIAQLSAWIRQEQFAGVIVLSTLDASLRRDQQLAEGVPVLFRVATSETVVDVDESQSNSVVASIQSDVPLLDFDVDGPPPPLSSLSRGAEAASSTTAATQLARLPKSSTGLLRPILLSLSSATAVPSAGLVLWAAEGDNRPDAHYLATVLRNFFIKDFQQQQQHTAGNVTALAEPPSWQGLFGSAPDQALFG